MASGNSNTVKLGNIVIEVSAPLAPIPLECKYTRDVSVFEAFDAVQAVTGDITKTTDSQDLTSGFKIDIREFKSYALYSEWVQAGLFSYQK